MKKTWFVRFFVTRTHIFDNKTMTFTKVEPYVTEACGTDSMFILDGRNSIAQMMVESVKYAARMKNIQQFTAYQIRLGTSSGDTNLSVVIPIKSEDLF